jgi:hypothetical protein
VDTVAQLRQRIYQKICYSTEENNCGTCDHSDPLSWDKNRGKCNVIPGLPFMVNEYGICKHHSNFGCNDPKIIFPDGD